MPTAITNVYQVNAPYGSWPPYYSVTNIINLPSRQNVTNITTGWEQPVLLPLWPHYTDIVTSYSMLGGGQTGIATNSANVSVDLYTGTSYNTAVLGQLNKFTLLSVGAYGVNNNSFSVPTIGFADISLVDEKVNADYKRFVKKPPATVLDATPTISSTSNFNYRVDVESHKIVTLSRAYHFRFGTNQGGPPLIDGLRANFEAGAALLSKDDDTKVPDSDKSVTGMR